jgi:hypothetical protein
MTVANLHLVKSGQHDVPSPFVKAATRRYIVAGSLHPLRRLSARNRHDATACLPIRSANRPAAPGIGTRTHIPWNAVSSHIESVTVGLDRPEMSYPVPSVWHGSC